MQAQNRWMPPVGTLGRIVAEAVIRAESLERQRGSLVEAANAQCVARPLAQALRGPSVTVLAEIKRCSPSKGDIAPDLDVVEQARAYAAGGAAAVSVLTEPASFGGSITDLIAVVREGGIPVLKKDFHIAPIQLIEARALGASAALLIARALSPDRFQEMMDTGCALGLELLVEVRDEHELARAIAAGATMIGVNNRDLETLVIDHATCDRLIPLIPAGTVAIAESGVRSRADVERYGAVGADAVLVGSFLSASREPALATRELHGVSRSARAR